MLIDHPPDHPEDARTSSAEDRCRERVRTVREYARSRGWPTTGGDKKWLAPMRALRSRLGADHWLIDRVWAWYAACGRDLGLYEVRNCKHLADLWDYLLDRFHKDPLSRVVVFPQNERLIGQVVRRGEPWPADRRSVEKTVQLSLDNLARLAAALAALAESAPDPRLGRAFARLLRSCPVTHPAHFVKTWFDACTDWMHRRGYTGPVWRQAVHPAHPEFGRWLWRELDGRLYDDALRLIRSEFGR